MKNVWTIADKEFKSYLASPMAYIVISIFLLFTSAFFTLLSPFNIATFNETSVNSFLQPASIMLLLFGPLLTMRLLAEERKLGTIELLLTAPVRDSEVIIGKFLAGVGVLLVMLGLTLYYPVLLFVFGDPDPGPIATGYLGLFLLGGVALAAGTFASSLTSNQVVAAVVGGGMLIALWFVGTAADFLPGSFKQVVGYVSLSNYFPDFMRGIIDTRGVVYYLSIIALFLFLGIRSLENSRWN
ncbi:MAG: ABC transporter permease subunit [Chloroflexi bacterium]|nr:ABC transporter permease subunit [Chloroflexota bacterium]